MHVTASATELDSTPIETEIRRFLANAAKTPNVELYRDRRGAERKYRSMPILFMRIDDGPQVDHSATLYNISNDGLAFYCDCGLQVGAVLAVKLFWSDREARRVPAIVRHCDITQEGFLIGAQFAIHHHEACELLDALSHIWYG